MDKHSYLSNGDLNAIEDLYNLYKKDPDSVDYGWQKFFEGFELATKNYETDYSGDLNFDKEFKVLNLIDGYRSRGHLFTKTNPVRERRKYIPTLEIENFGLEEKDLKTVFQAGKEVGIGPATLEDIIAHLKLVYCESIGVEYMYIRIPKVVDWIKSKLHENSNHPSFSADQKKHILDKLNEAVIFESFMHTKFVGQKRFSLEGAESLIPALDTLVETAADNGAEEFVFGMAHRGRLNVLAHIFNKNYSDIFTEFEGKDYEDKMYEGDVKYHLGFSTDRKTKSGKNVHLSIAANPSHLEAVDPVVEGVVRAKVDHKYDNDYSKIVPVLIHGDASIAGQGVVYEVVQMAQLEGYKTGGTIHIVINNQVGFTTNYLDARSSTYCTDVGKVTLSPIFHVNGDDPEALSHVMRIAVEYRQKFQKDVFIDLLCYRKYGHNEGDEPRFTQPLLYKKIARHPNPKKIYSERLIEEGVITAEFAKDIERKLKNKLDGELDLAKANDTQKIGSHLNGSWKGLRQGTVADFEKEVDTKVDLKKLQKIAKTINELPSDKKFFKKIEKVFNDRRTMIAEDRLDWGTAETLAYATLLTENHSIRFSGQDVERGTFSHRHAILKIEDSEEEYSPLNFIQKKQGRFQIYNSLLSEYGVLGFDYGYAMASPNDLVVWEAQFGDFSNGAQIIFDQFISCAEEKWKRMSGIVLMLPHGYEGQGAEHSSARMERYLQLCAEGNMQMVNCTTPANLFHVLRRQLKRDFRKPLVIFTPKKLLRYPTCISTMDELANGTFKEIIDDELPVKSVETIAFCSGKIYYDLLEKRNEIGDKSIALVRMEQLYPLPSTQLEKIIKKYKGAKRLLWVQEEPKNMGAWSHILRHFSDFDLEVIARPSSGVTATGSPERHLERQNNLLEDVFKYSVVNA
ncbi:MAG: 2-oxoglutarate dehydrogenase E1 component [Flavobacteriales bacterium]|nr:2-oxoglutarate dehydrogenase E1 component [Flavobacteriales bacterium]